MLDRKVAVKLLHPRLTRDGDSLQRFLREAKAASALNHPNILTVYEIGKAGELQFIATEFIDGITLREKLEAGPIAFSETLEIIRQVPQPWRPSLGRHRSPRHQTGEHHDPADGLTKVLDFGLARFTERRPYGHGVPESGATVKTTPGTLMGTITYMSPEQARGLEVNARADQSASLSFLYEMVTGHPPFKGSTPADVLVAILDKPAPKPGHLHRGRTRRPAGRNQPGLGERSRIALPICQGFRGGNRTPEPGSPIPLIRLRSGDAKTPWLLLDCRCGGTRRTTGVRLLSHAGFAASLADLASRR